MANIGDGRPVRKCGVCGITDDHPRHVSVGTHDTPGPETEHHMDCGREAGCEQCTEKTRGAEELTGADLLAHLTKGAA